MYFIKVTRGSRSSTAHMPVEDTEAAREDIPNGPASRLLPQVPIERVDMLRHSCFDQDLESQFKHPPSLALCWLPDWLIEE